VLQALLLMSMALRHVLLLPLLALHCSAVLPLLLALPLVLM
jgi:hypothetical protein